MTSAFRPRFFIPLPVGVGSTPGLELDLMATDERHARVVLRARPGDPCEVVLLDSPAPPRAASEAIGPSSAGLDDGRPAPPGTLFSAVFVSRGTVLAVRLENPAPASRSALSLVLLQALPEPGAVDLIVQKGTEVGVDSFVLFGAYGSPRRGTERSEKRLARWRRIAEEAARQSKQLAVPPVSLAASLEAGLELVDRWGGGKLVLDPGGGLSLRDALRENGVNQAGPLGADEAARLLALIVGPEGGWHSAELELFARRALPVASLGRRVLRAETAGLVAAAVTRFALEDL